MITCNLTKPEATLDHVRKSFPKLVPTDAAMIASALVLSGRYAAATYDDREYQWPDQYGDLTKSMTVELHQVQVSIEGTAKKTKATVEEEPVEVTLHLKPNYAVGESMLGDRDDLKTLLSDILQSGVEFVYGPTDIGWQWALDRANWETLSGGELTRRIKLKPVFAGDSVGVEMGSKTARRRATKPKPATPEPES